MVTRVSGNTTYYAIALRQLTFTSGSGVEEDFSPEQTDVVRVVLHGGRAYEYTPTVSGNLLQFADEGGTLPIGSYDVEVLIDREGGQQLRAMQRGGLLIVEASGDALAYSSEARLDAQTFIISSTGDISALENRVAACERTDVAQNEAIDVLQAGKADLSGLDYKFLSSAPPTIGASSITFKAAALNEQGAFVPDNDFDIPAATSETAGVMSSEQVQELAGKADATSVPVRVVCGYNRVEVYNSANEILFYIPAAELPNSGVMSAQQTYDLINLKSSVPTKQDKVALVEEDSASLVGTLTPSAGSYTRFLYAQNTVAVELPAIPSNTTTALALSIYLETGSSPQVTFTSADNTPIAYYDGFAIDANTEYEINCLYNGAKWILAYGVVA